MKGVYLISKAYPSGVLHSIIDGNRLHNAVFYRFICDTFRAIKPTLENMCKKENIPVSSIDLVEGKSYLCMFVTWVSHGKPQEVKIDLVPAVPYKYKVDIGDSFYVDSVQTSCQITIRSPFSKSAFNIGTSDIESDMISTLPDYIKHGYKIAKTVRRTVFVAPIMEKLLNLGVVYDLEDLIPSFLLKTCLFYCLKANGKPDTCKIHNSTNRASRFCAKIKRKPCQCKLQNSMHWAIQIYRKLKWLVKEQFEVVNFCIPQEKLFFCCGTRNTYGSLCCRKRKSILIVCDQIIQALQQNQSMQTSRVENELTAFV